MIFYDLSTGTLKIIGIRSDRATLLQLYVLHMFLSRSPDVTGTGGCRPESGADTTCSCDPRGSTGKDNFKFLIYVLVT